ncbi:MAG: hypothetical protein WC027_00940 [Candidatus Paceibacterota bacterium]
MKVIAPAATSKIVFGHITLSPPVISEAEYGGLIKDTRMHSREIEKESGRRLVCDVAMGLENLFQAMRDTPPEISKIGVVFVSRRLEDQAVATVKYLEDLHREGLVFLCDFEHNKEALVRGGKGFYLAHHRHLRRGAIVSMLVS